MKKVLLIILMILMTAAFGAFAGTSAAMTEIYGQKVSSDEAYLSFSGAEIKSVDELKEKISTMRNLKSADLGSYDVDITEADSLTREFPGVQFTFRTVADMYGSKFYTDVEELDMSSVQIEDTEKLSEMLKYFYKTKKVTLGENAVPVEQREQLKSDYPNLEFNIVAVYDVYGLKCREDAETLDLKSITPDSALPEKLKLFPKLKYVDFHGVALSNEYQLSITSQFPDIDFGWTVDFAGTPIDSSQEVVDISGKYMPGHIEELKKILPILKHTKKIVMCDCYLSNEELGQLQADCPDVKIAWRIYLGVQWSLRTDDVAFSVLIYQYGYRPMTTADIQVLKYCTDLQALDLGHQAISDISVIGDYLTNLRLLILADNNLTDLSPLAKLPHLHYLEFFVNNVTDLTPLASCTQLVDLNISYNHGLSDITPLLNLPKLERLWLESTAVSQESLQLLYNTYPNATIVYYGQGSVDQGWRSHERYFAMMDMWLNHPDYIGEEFTKYD